MEATTMKRTLILALVLTGAFIGCKKNEDGPPATASTSPLPGITSTTVRTYTGSVAPHLTDSVVVHEFSEANRDVLTVSASHGWSSSSIGVCGNTADLICYTLTESTVTIKNDQTSSVSWIVQATIHI